MNRYWLVRSADAAPGWPLEDFARTAGLHPHLVGRLVRLGVLTPDTDAAGRHWFPAAQLRRLARIERLRAGLGLNYAAVAVVLDLLDRIDDLERELRARPRATPDPRRSW